MEFMASGLLAGIEVGFNCCGMGFFYLFKAKDYVLELYLNRCKFFVQEMYGL